MTANTTSTALVALDWGTSNLRARRLGRDGETLELRSAPVGVMAVPAGGFEAALRDLCDDWIAPATPIVASGMVGSRQGWREAPYLDCPATLADAAQRLTRVELAGGAALHIAPGLRCTGSDGQLDVMRGEETQLWGAGLSAGDVCVLPGTHSKWARVGAQGRVDGFETAMTGELYAVLRGHSLLGRLMQDGHDDAAFAQGVQLGLAEHGHLTHALFAVRTAGLGGTLAATALPDFLSGLLIGTEIAGATRRARPATVTLLGDDALCDRYASALRFAGIASTRAPAEATTRGQWRIAQAAALVQD